VDGTAVDVGVEEAREIGRGGTNGGENRQRG